MSADPLGQAVRTRRRQVTLGVDPDNIDAPAPACVICGERRLFALHTKIGHHIAGRRNDPNLTATLCLNCHAEQTEDHRQVGVPLRDNAEPPPTLLDRLAALLAGAGVFLTELGGRLVEWADVVHAHIAELDRQLPTWRDAVASIPGPPGISIPPVPAMTASEPTGPVECGHHDN